MYPPPEKPPKHDNLKGGGSSVRQNAHLSQSGPSAKEGAYTSAEGAVATRDSPEATAYGQQVTQTYHARGPPTVPIGVPQQIQTRQTSRTQPQTFQPTGEQTQLPLPAAFAQDSIPVAAATGHMPPQPGTQTNVTNQTTRGQTPPPPHGQTPQPAQAQIPRTTFAQGSTSTAIATGHWAPQPLAQGNQTTLGQTPPPPYEQTSQPTQEQIPRTTEEGTSSHDQQRNTDGRSRSARVPAVTAYGHTTARSKR